MKKLMYFAAALLVLVGCNNKDNALNNAPEGAPFKKGQQVTLTVGTGDNNQAAPRRVAGTDNGTQINFTWEEGDKILVKVGQKSAVFTLSSEPGLEYGEFTGTMPADGSTFDIQYPITTPTGLGAQVYTTTKTIPANKMLFTATDCMLGNNAILQAQYAMVQLNLFGTDKTVGQIVFTNTTASPAESYTLTCTDGVQIGATSTAATPFYMVVSAGEYKFEVAVYDNATTPAKICSFATSEAKTFVAGECLNMPAKFVPTYVDLGLSVKWASMNVGATAPQGYGVYIMWGERSERSEQDYDWYSYKYYNGSDESMTKYCVTDGKTILDSADDIATAEWGGAWRTPTQSEAQELVDKCTWEWTENYNSTGINGYTITSNVEGYQDKSIFLPAAGYRLSSQSDDVQGASFRGDYWTSSLDERNSSQALGFGFYYRPDEHNINYGANGSYYRCDGHSVRPVLND